MRFLTAGRLWALSKCAAPIWYELNYGVAMMQPSSRRDFLEQYIQQTVRPNYPILPYDEAAAAWHASERARRTRSDQPTPIADTMIAAMRKAYMETISELTAEHGNLKAVMDDFAQFMTEYKKWESVGMIRRDETMFD